MQIIGLWKVLFYAMLVIAQKLFFIQTPLLHTIVNYAHTFLIQSCHFAVSKILISTGFPRNSATKTTEIINIDNEVLTSHVNCKDLDDYPLKISGAVGSNMGSFPVLCGGRDNSGSVNQCHRLESGKWEPFANLAEKYIY